jgi:2'-hydroxyisoflavone reductase
MSSTSQRVLVLGGSAFVGRAIADTALASGHAVTTLNRGRTHRDVEGVHVVHADRTDHTAVADALDGMTFDVVVDTWSGAPVHATVAARLLADRTTRYAYVSSRSVYTWPIAAGADESHPVVDGDAESVEADDYAQQKRGGELGVLSARPDALIARCGLILGPHENVGRLPWWLLRLARGGRVPAPGPRDRPLQLIDARDLALWILSACTAGTTGIFDTVSRPGHATIGELLDAALDATGHAAQLVWVTPESIEQAGVAPWTSLPIWLPPTGDIGALHDSNTSAAERAGLRCRSIVETVDDTWAWLAAFGDGEIAAAIPGLAMHGTTAEQEATLLA